MSSTKPKRPSRAVIRRYGVKRQHAASVLAPLPAEEVREVRRLWGLTQQQFADMLGVTRVTVWRWESGHKQYAQHPRHLLRMRRMLAQLIPGRAGGRARMRLGVKLDRRSDDAKPTA